MAFVKILQTLQGGGIEFSGIDEFINTLLENISNFQSQIDFNLLETLSNCHSNQSEASEESTNFKNNSTSTNGQFAKTFYDNDKELKELLASLPTPPPQGWERKKLGEVENIIIEKGKSITQKDTKTGNIKVVAGGLDFAYFHNEANRPKNTITISASGANAGFVNFWEEEIFASDCTTININSITTIKFIFYTLQTMQNIIYSLARGAAQPHVYPDDLKQIQIPLPLSDSQNKIVTVIENIESKIESLSQNLKFIEDAKEQILQKYL